MKLFNKIAFQKKCFNVVLKAEWVIEEKKPSEFWPDEGKVHIDNYSVRYREGMDMVLHSISADINGGDKVQ